MSTPPHVEIKKLRCLSDVERVILVTDNVGQIFCIKGNTSVFNCSNKQLYLTNFFTLMTDEAYQHLVEQCQNSPFSYLKNDANLQICPHILNSCQFQCEFIIRKNRRSNQGYTTKKMQVQLYRCYGYFCSQNPNHAEISTYQEQHNPQQSQVCKELFVVLCTSQKETKPNKKKAKKQKQTKKEKERNRHEELDDFNYETPINRKFDDFQPLFLD